MFNESFNTIEDTMLSKDSTGEVKGFASYGSNLSMGNKNKIRITQIHESVDYDALCQMRALRFQPPLGQCIAM